ncbi:hypothetical protein AYO45_06665 [Gammaproteobacteria bacterium SCGC AG-212-F23]|nr:hypothetical protein AYO45_06665 [Gammaproteobacteria bacterium SCGC AG-212-F23]
MIELIRIVEDQARLSSYRATQNEERAIQLELMIEKTKPKNFHLDWHTLIATPFRYNPPHPSARFRPPFGKNVFYASCAEETALYEHAFHFMRERIHLDIQTETGIRTLFSVAADHSQAIDIRHNSKCKKIINKIDYSASYEFIKTNPNITFIFYPSCRDPHHRDNAAIFDIKHLEKTLKKESSIKFFYDNPSKKLTWIDYHLHINWKEVS